MTQNEKMQVVERAMKIYELSQRGEGGEAVNAALLLEQYLAKHGMTLDELLNSSEGASACLVVDIKTKQEGELVMRYLEKLTDTARENLDTFCKGIRSRYVSHHKGLTSLEKNIAEAFVPLLLDAYRATVSAMRKRHSLEKKSLLERQKREQSMRLPAFVIENDCYLRTEFTDREATDADIKAYRAALEDVEEVPAGLIGHEQKLIGEGVR